MGKRMAPNPSAETVAPVLPNGRYCIIFLHYDNVAVFHLFGNRVGCQRASVGEGESSKGGHAASPKGLADPQGFQRPKALVIAAAAQGRL